MAEEIIAKYKEHPQCLNEGKLLPVLSNQKMNAYLKEMAADMRLIDSSLYEDHPNHKVNVCARKLADIFNVGGKHIATL